MKNYCRKLFIALLSLFIFSLTQSQTKIRSILTDKKTVFIGTNYGVYSNQNNICDWKLSNNGIPDGYDISKLAKFKNSIFGYDQSSVLFISKDSGVNWKKVLSFPNDFINVNSIYANDTSLFIIDLDKGIIYTSDEGLTWKSVDLLNWLNPNKINNKNEIKESKSKEANSKEKIILEKRVTDLITTGTVMLAGVTSRSASSCIYQSSDNGSTWIEASFDLQNVNVNRIYKNGNKIYVVTAGLNAGIYCSENNGINWEQLSKPPMRSITSFTSTSQQLFVGNYYDGVCTSTDNGLTWSKLDALVLKKKQTVDHLAITEEGLFIGTSDGIICMTNEDGNWKIKNEGLNTKKIGSFTYSTVGTQSGVTLSANKLSDEIIFQVNNTSNSNIKIHIKVKIECEYASELGMVALPKQEIDWLISVDANSIKSYDTSPEECAISSCKNNTKSWEVVSWEIIK